MNCIICNHEHRADIENILMHYDPSVTIDMLAEEYDVPADDIRRHMIFHTPIGINEEDSDSIARKLKMRESDMLTEVALDYLVTLKGMGRRVNRYLNEGDESIKLEKLLTKPVVDMYLGLGAEIRQTVKAIADIDQLLNGPKEDNTSGLAALAAAINGSRQVPTSE